MDNKSKKTVLVIDDDQAIRKLLGKILEKFGYQVISSATGQEGIELFKREHERVALIILDYTLPDMSCHKVYQKIIELKPEVQLVVTSGLDENMIKDNTADYNNVKDVLYKPFRVERLLEMLKNTLGDSSL